MSEKTLKDKAQEAEKEVKELSLEELDQASGAGNPFEDIPRVPNNPIDEKLRNKA